MSENEKITELLSKQFYLHFSEMGSYDSLEYWFDTLKEAEARLKKMQKRYPKHFAFIAKPIKVVKTE